MLPRAIQVPCLGFFMVVTAKVRASLYDSFNGINIYSLMSLFFIASASGMPASNIITIDLKNETLTDFDLQSNQIKTINLINGNKITISSGNKNTVPLERKNILSLRKYVKRLQHQIFSLKTESNNKAKKIDKLTKEVSRLSLELEMIGESSFHSKKDLQDLSSTFYVFAWGAGTLIFITMYIQWLQSKSKPVLATDTFK